jgi:site-specific DNA-methyltransferase (adenine-specific)
MRIGNGEFWHGDCLELMKQIPDGSVDMVLCDLPYGTTYAKWDNVINIDTLFEEYRRICKQKSPIVLTAVDPFSALIITKRIKEYRYSWVWNKENASNFANAKIQPLKQHEFVLVFGFESPNYYPIKMAGKKNHIQGKSKINASDTRLINTRVEDDLSGLKYPKSILNFPKHSSQVGLHPTQKPVSLFEYLIKTYSNEGDTVLDNCAGSGTTAIAAENINRNWICIEQDKTYYNAAIERIREHIQ